MNSKKKILIMISGRGSNMEAIVKNCQTAILQNVCEILEVFSNKEDAAGLVIAQNYGIKTTVISSKKKKRKTYNNLLLEYLKNLNPDYIVLAGYMKILESTITQSFPKRIINIHPADTSKHQGLGGYNWAWKQRLTSSKITVHFVDAGLDTGNVIAKQDVNLRGCNSLTEVEKRGLSVEHKFYSECLMKVLSEK